MAVLALLMPFHVNAAVIDFTPRLYLGEQYTSNFYLSRDHEEKDFSTIVSPGFTTQIQGKTSNMSVTYNPSYNYYSDHAEYSRWFHLAELNGAHRVTKRTTINLADSFLYTSEPTGSPAESSTRTIESGTQGTTGTRTSPSFDATRSSPSFDSAASPAFDSIGNRQNQLINGNISARRNRDVYFSNFVNLGVLHHLHENDTVGLNYAHGLLKNDDPDVADNESHNPNLTLSYWVVPNQWRIEAGGGFTKAVFEGPTDDFHNRQADAAVFKQFDRHFEGYLRYNHSIMSFQGTTEDYQVYSPTIGVRYAASEDTNIDVSVGYFLQDRKVSDDESGALIDCDLQTAWRFRQGAIYLNGSSGYRMSYLDASNLGFTLYYGADIRFQYHFTRHASSDCFTSYRLDDYLDSSTGNADREDHNFEYGLGFTYQILSWLSSRVQGSSRLLKSTVHENDFLDNRLSVGLTISPSQPYRY